MNEGVEAIGSVGGWERGACNYSSYGSVIKTLESGMKSFHQTIECAGAGSIDFDWKTFFLRFGNFLPTFHPSVSPRPSFIKFTAAEGNSLNFSFSKQNFSETHAEIPFGCYAIKVFLDETEVIVKSCRPNDGETWWNVK